MDRHHSASGWLLAALVLTAALAGSAQAASDESSVLDAIVDESDSPLDQARDVARFALNYARGQLAAALDGAPLVGDDTAWNAEAVAESLTEDVSGNASAYQSWLNDRVTATTDRDVIEFDIENASTTATLYVTADVTNDSYANLTAVQTTNRTVDATCTLAGAAGRNAPAELRRFREQFVDADENVSTAFTGRLAGRYQDDIDCPVITENT